MCLWASSSALYIKLTVLHIVVKKNRERFKCQGEGSFGEKHCSAVYHLHHLNRDYGNLQPSPGCGVALLPLLSCLPRKPLQGLSQLTELFVQLLHREEKSTRRVKLHTPHHKNKNHPAGTRGGTLAHKHMIHFSQLSLYVQQIFLYLHRNILPLCCSFQSLICKSS